MNNKKKQVLALVLALICVIFCGCSKAENMVQTTTNNVETTAHITTKKVTQSKAQTTTEKTTETTTKNEVSTTKTTTKKEEKTTKKVVNSTTKKEKTTTENVTENQPFKLTIQCKEILNNIDDLAKGHEDFVPKNGVIIDDFSCDFEENQTAFDVLKKACKQRNIKLTTKNTGYGIYVVGINNLDEFDCGKYSGWKYKVNGVEPNKACDKYQLSKGDRVEFFYVCTY